MRNIEYFIQYTVANILKYSHKESLPMVLAIYIRVEIDFKFLNCFSINLNGSKREK